MLTNRVDEQAGKCGSFVRILGGNQTLSERFYFPVGSSIRDKTADRI